MARTVPGALIDVVCALAVSPASAQWGTIFGGDPPRPPGSVPRSEPPPPPPPPSPFPPFPGSGPRGGVQSQPLPPPPGAPTAPEARAPAAAPPSPLPGLPPGVRQPRAPATAATPPPNNDEIITEPPAQKIANPQALFSGLDKITGRILPFEVAINETVRFGALEVTPRVCYTRPPTETPNTDAFIEVDEVTLQGELRRIFTGWMFAASPGLNGVEHPIYDVWLTDCKGGTPPVAAAPPETAPPARTPPRAPPPPRRNPPPSPLPPPPR
jgi:hypothetical protein